jgi:hypothetical protein
VNGNGHETHLPLCRSPSHRGAMDLFRSETKDLQRMRRKAFPRGGAGINRAAAGKLISTQSPYNPHAIPILFSLAASASPDPFINRAGSIVRCWPHPTAIYRRSIARWKRHCLRQRLWCMYADHVETVWKNLRGDVRAINCSLCLFLGDHEVAKGPPMINLRLFPGAAQGDPLNAESAVAVQRFPGNGREAR